MRPPNGTGLSPQSRRSDKSITAPPMKPKTSSASAGAIISQVLSGPRGSAVKLSLTPDKCFGEYATEPPAEKTGQEAVGTPRRTGCRTEQMKRLVYQLLNNAKIPFGGPALPKGILSMEKSCAAGRGAPSAGYAAKRQPWGRRAPHRGLPAAAMSPSGIKAPARITEQSGDMMRQAGHTGAGTLRTVYRVQRSSAAPSGHRQNFRPAS